MVITDYHVQSVLRTYSRQLQRSKLTGKNSREEGEVGTERVSISDQARQQLLMDRAKSQALSQAKSDPETGPEEESSEPG